MNHLLSDDLRSGSCSSGVALTFVFNLYFGQKCHSHSPTRKTQTLERTFLVVNCHKLVLFMKPSSFMWIYAKVLVTESFNVFAVYVSGFVFVCVWMFAKWYIIFIIFYDLELWFVNRTIKYKVTTLLEQFFGFVLRFHCISCSSFSA